MVVKFYTMTHEHPVRYDDDDDDCKIAFAKGHAGGSHASELDLWCFSNVALA
jgi:hypothetical protein